jgi:hypothetical protein
MMLKYNIPSYVLYAKYECRGSIQKQNTSVLSLATPVRSPDNKITFLTLKCIDMEQSIGSAARTLPQVLCWQCVLWPPAA